VARQNYELCRREPWLIAASKLLNRTPLNPTGEGVLDEYEERRRAWEATFLGRGQELGVIRKDLPSDLLVTVAFSFWQAANLWLLDRAENLGATDLIRYSFQLIESYRAILSPPLAPEARRVVEVPDGAVPAEVPRSTPGA